MKKLIAIIFSIFLINQSHAYIFGIKSADNSPQNILDVEKVLGSKAAVVSFIFDPFGEQAITSINALTSTLGSDRIFHLTISPDNFSAKQIAESKFDYVYRNIFKKIKDQDIRVIFRTMHEMNGGRYPRASDPQNFKKARIHVRQLSREEGLDHHNILFDFSINHRDMPTTSTPSQTAPLTECTTSTKYFSGTQTCFSFEDYYPGDEYVDIMGVTFFNRGKATSDRKRLSPKEILHDPRRNTLDRLKSFNKPIFIDEVGTTAVYYQEFYNPKKSLEVYNTERNQKNYRLMHLKLFLQNEPQIIGFSYFNVDYTQGLQCPTTGEADRSAINITQNKTYFGIFDLKKHSAPNANTLRELFETIHISMASGTYLIRKDQRPALIEIAKKLQNKTLEEKKLLLNELGTKIQNDANIPTSSQTLLLKNIQILKNLSGL